MNASSRNVILKVIRAATNAAANRFEDVPRDYVRTGELDAKGRIRLMTERLAEYGADVLECVQAELPAVILRQLQQSAKQHLVVPQSLPAAWLGEGVNWLVDRNLGYEEIEQCDAVLTAASAGVAESGTIVLHHGPMEGRRVISLLPDFHLCVLRASQIVETLPEYFAMLTTPPRLATYISGPSATADIEMTRIKGVHGPRFLSVIIVRDDF